MKPFEVTLLAICLIPAYAVGWYFYKPELSVETKHFLALAPEAASPEDLARYQYLEKKMSDHDLLVPESCLSQIYSARCWLVAQSTPHTQLDGSYRSSYRESLELLPLLASSFEDLPAYQELIKAANNEFFLGMAANHISRETVQYQLIQTQRLMTEATTLVDYMISAALYGISVAGTNMALAMDPEMDFEPEALLSYNVTDESVVPLLAGELKVVYLNYMADPKVLNDVNKFAWLMEDYRSQWQQHADFLDQTEAAYWSKSLHLERGVFSRLHEQYVLGMDPEWQGHHFLHYFDAAKLTVNSDVVLQALAEIYRGAAIDNHGIPAPESWRWHWQEDAMELCLELSEEIERTERVKDAVVCLPHLRMQIERLEASAGASLSAAPEVMKKDPATQ